MRTGICFIILLLYFVETQADIFVLREAKIIFVDIRPNAMNMDESGALLINDAERVKGAEIIREKETNRNKFFSRQIDILGLIMNPHIFPVI